MGGPRVLHRNLHRFSEKRTEERWGLWYWLLDCSYRRLVLLYCATRPIQGWLDCDWTGLILCCWYFAVDWIDTLLFHFLSISIFISPFINQIFWNLSIFQSFQIFQSKLVLCLLLLDSGWPALCSNVRLIQTGLVVADLAGIPFVHKALCNTQVYPCLGAFYCITFPSVVILILRSVNANLVLWFWFCVQLTQTLVLWFLILRFG